MEGSEQLWVELGRGASLSGEESQVSQARLETAVSHEWQALFACQVVPRSFEELLKLKWGFSPAFLLEEARDRQRLFLETLHPHDFFLQQEQPEKRTIALRCIHYQDCTGLVLSLVGKVCAPHPEMARQAALEFWHEIRSIFPVDYRLFPAETREMFRCLAGWSILKDAHSPAGNALVSRPFKRWTTGQHQLLLLGEWNTLEHSDEQIWRALANSPEPVVLDLLLRPTILYTAEQVLLTGLKDVSSQVSKDETLNAGQTFAAWSATSYKRRSVSFIHPYLMQVRLVSNTCIPEYLIRAVGSVLTRTPKVEDLALGYQVMRPAARAEAASWAVPVFWLERLPNQEYGSNYDRLFDMVDIGEAHAVFRLPYPPEPGLPGVSFNQLETISG